MNSQTRSNLRVPASSWHTLAAILALLLPCGASATLGEADATLNSDIGKGSKKIFAEYRRTEVSAASGPRVRQFVSAQDNRVFAVSWTGRMDEGITTLLGAYSVDLQSYDKTHPLRTGRIPYRKVDAGRVVFEFWDLPKMVKGRAYLPGQMPANVTTDNID